MKDVALTMEIFESIEIGSIRLKNRLFRSVIWLGAAGSAERMNKVSVV